MADAQWGPTYGTGNSDFDLLGALGKAGGGLWDWGTSNPMAALGALGTAGSLAEHFLAANKASENQAAMERVARRPVDPQTYFQQLQQQPNEQYMRQLSAEMRAAGVPYDSSYGRNMLAENSQERARQNMTQAQQMAMQQQAGMLGAIGRRPGGQSTSDPYKIMQNAILSHMLSKRLAEAPPPKRPVGGGTTDQPGMSGVSPTTGMSMYDQTQEFYPEIGSRTFPQAQFGNLRAWGSGDDEFDAMGMAMGSDPSHGPFGGYQEP